MGRVKEMLAESHERAESIRKAHSLADCPTNALYTLRDWVDTMLKEKGNNANFERDLVELNAALARVARYT